MEHSSPELLRKHLSVITEEIGVRLAGSREERRAAEYLAKCCASYGARCTLDEFPVLERRVKEERLEVLIGGKWEVFPCSLFGAAPSTGGKTLEGEIVFFDSHTDYQRKDLSFLRGKAVVHLGCHIDTREKYGRLMKAAPAFLLFVDTRYPGVLPLADGLFPSYAAEYGALPTMNTAYMDAFNWHTRGASKARLTVSGDTVNSTSVNLIAELPGSEKDSGVIYAGGHHDTQAGTVGADDNAVGSAAVVELVRIFSGRPHKKTFRFCSFGAEEQLSVGSSSYVRSHRAEIAENGRFMFNFDSFGSALGWTRINFNGAGRLRPLLTETFNGHDIYFEFDETLTPFVDNFPFAAAGVPGLWLSRDNCQAGRFYHHRADNTMNRLSFEVMAAHIDAAADFIGHLSEDALPSKAFELPAKRKPAVETLWNEVYGGWKK